MRLVFCVLVLSGFAGVAGASTLAGAGGHRCADVLALDETDPQTARRRYFNWAQGWLTASNLVTLADAGEAVNLTPSHFNDEAQWAFARDYCRHHPDQAFEEAVKELFSELQRQTGRRGDHN